MCVRESLRETAPYFLYLFSFTYSLFTVERTHMQKIAHISIQVAKHEALLNICFLGKLHHFIGICL